MLNSTKSKFSLADLQSLISALVIVALLFSSVVVIGQVYAAQEQEAVTLTVTIDTALTFNVDSATASFGTLSPGTPKLATTTLLVTTNDTSGWRVALAGDDQSPTDTVMDLTTDPSVGITDQAEWIPGVATTSAGNAVRLSLLDNSGDVLAFRVMSASSTNGEAFLAPTWWGSQDNYLTDSANTLWAGIASSTVSRVIGNAGAGSYSASVHINTVQYYLDVPASQQSGSYSGALTYTATTNT